MGQLGVVGRVKPISMTQQKCFCIGECCRHFSEAAVLNIASFLQSQTEFRNALCDSFNTPLALDILLKLVSATNVYLRDAKATVSTDLTYHIAKWTTEMLRMFGLGEGVDTGEIGWGNVATADNAGNVSESD